MQDFEVIQDSFSESTFALDAKISFGRYLFLRSLHGIADLLLAVALNFAAIAIFLACNSYVECIPFFDIALMHACGAAAYCLFVVASPFWFLIAKCGSSSNGWTTRALGLRVVDSHGRNISNFRALLRAVIFFLTWFLLPVHLGFIVFGKRRMLHDVCTGTHVVCTRVEPSYSYEEKASFCHFCGTDWLQGKYNGAASARYIHYATCTAFLALAAGDDAATREFIHALVGR